MLLDGRSSFQGVESPLLSMTGRHLLRGGFDHGHRGLLERAKLIKNRLPHYGHLLTSTIKDIIPRYWSMNGRYVERRFGWDTHGLPIEHEIDKKFGMLGSQVVEKLGLAGYNAECKLSKPFPVC